MPNRILRDWTDSEAVNSLSWQAECLFIRLIMKADDYGCFHGNEKLLKSLLFPLKDGLRDADIARWLTELSASGLIRKYSDEGGKPFIEIRNYNQRLKNSRRKFPEPPEDSGKFQELPGTSRNFPADIESETETRIKEKDTEKEKTPLDAAALSVSFSLNHPKNPGEVIAEAEKHGIRISESQAQDFIDANSVTAQGETWMFRNTPVRDWRKLMNSRWITNWKRDNEKNGDDEETPDVFRRLDARK